MRSRVRKPLLYPSELRGRAAATIACHCDARKRTPSLPLDRPGRPRTPARLQWIRVRRSNVTVPAHYHGCIVGVTLAFMGMTYHLLPRLGFQAVAQRLAVWQLWIYGSGQLLHIIGLAWSGGYGVQRKTAGAAQGLHSIQQIAGMGLMGAGGLIAIIGGLLFLVVVFRAMHKRTSA